MAGRPLVRQPRPDGVRAPLSSARPSPAGARPKPLRPLDYGWTIVPHTHWDREWYQPYELFRLRLVRMIDELLDVLETVPEFAAFSLDGQSVILEDYLEVRPDQATRLRALFEAGRLAIGPSYVLPDEFLAPQEALVRNLLIGTRVARAAGARRSRIGYQPDPFGHVAQMPQVLRGFGLDTFLFWRGLGEPGEHLGSLFTWRGPDGSAVVAIRQLGGYGNASQLGRWGREGRDHVAQPERWKEVAVDRLQRYLDTWGVEVARDGIGRLLLCNGSDHEPAWKPLPGLVDAIRRAHPGIDVAVATYDDYVNQLDARLDALPVVEGELRAGRDAHILRGIDSIRMPLKQANERAALDLLAAEAVASLALLRGRTHPVTSAPGSRQRQDPRPGLDRAWKLLLRNQPHDSISGCSVDPVHREMEMRYGLVEQLAARVGREAVAALGGATLTWDPESATDDVAPACSVVNPLPHPRIVAVELALGASLATGREPLVAELGDGTVTPAQRLGHRGVVAVGLDGFATRSIRIRRTAPDDESRRVDLSGDSGPATAHALVSGAPGQLVRQPWSSVHPEEPVTIENGRLRLHAQADGSFTVEDLVRGRTLRGVGRFEDVADRGDEYTFCPIEDEPEQAFRVRRVSRRVIATGPVVAELEVRLDAWLPARLSGDRTRRVGRVRMPVRTVARLVAGGDRVEITTSLVNHARDHRLRVVVPAPDAADGADGADGALAPNARDASQSAYPPAEVRAEGHFAVIRRPARPPAPSRPERWAELPQAPNHTTGFVAAGSTVLIGHGLPEYEAIERPQGGLEIALTLLRSVGWLSRDDLATRPGGAGPAVETPDAQGLGPHTFRYDVRLDGDLDDATLVRASADARWPIVTGAPIADVPPEIGVRGNVAFAALKPAEQGGGIVLRVYNPGRDRTPIGIDAPAADLWRVRLDETPADPVELPETLAPGEILTVRVEPRPVVPG